MNEELKTIQETAKATQELAKATSKAIGATKQLGSFVSKYIEGPLEQTLGIINDKLIYMRWERQYRLIEKANEFLSERGYQVPVNQLPPKLAIPILQNASLEEDNYLQDKWALLLVNASDPNFPLSIEIKHTSILNELSIFDVKLLDKICSEASNFDNLIVTLELPDKVLPGDGEIDEGAELSQEVQLSIENLIRLGLLRNETFSHAMLRVRVMALGWNFYDACTK
jgi:hypothetical protein